MSYSNSYLLALFDWSAPPFFTSANTAVSKDVQNYLKKASHSKVVKFANYPVQETESLQLIHILVPGKGSGSTVVPLKKLDCITLEDRLIIIGHGDSTQERLAEYSPSALALQLQDWGLYQVGTIYLCACELGIGQFPHKFGTALLGLVSFKSIRAPLGVVQINDQGHKEIFKDNSKAQSLPKGENKVIISDTSLWDSFLK